MMEYPTFVSCLAAMADSEDPVAQAIALETVGYIGVSLEGKVPNLIRKNIRIFVSKYFSACTGTAGQQNDGHNRPT